MPSALAEKLKANMTPEQIEANRKRMKDMIARDLASPGDTAVKGTPTTPEPTAPVNIADKLDAKKRSKSIDNTVADAMSGLARPRK